MSKGICKLCRCEKNLIKAHVFPRRFNQDIKGQNKKGNRIYSTNSSSQHSQGGVYDINILCADCDGKVIGKWDNYGQTFLRRTLNNWINAPNSPIKIHNIGSKKLLEIPQSEFNYSKLKLFFLSVLFRCAISNHRFCSQVILGEKHLSALRKMLLIEEPGDEYKFSIFLKKYNDSESKLISPPFRTRSDNGVNGYWCHIPQYGFYVKVDSRKCSDDVSKFILSDHKPFYIVMEDLMKSNDSTVISDFIKTAK